MSVRKHMIWFVAAILVLVLGIPGVSSGEQALVDEVPWEVVDDEDMPEEVRIWVEQNNATRGVHLLPSGDVRYLLIAWGERPTGGYVVEIDFVTEFANVVTVDVTLTEPDPDDAVSQALTYPYQLLSLPAGDETVMVNFMGASWHGDALGKVSDSDEAIILEAVVDEDGVAPNPLVIRGRAQVYEATFWLVLEDGHRHLSDDMLTAAVGGPDWAEFEVILTYADPSSPSGTVIGGYDSAKDGSAVEVAFEPVAFGPVSWTMPDVSGHIWAEAWIRMGVSQGFIDGYPPVDESNIRTFRPEKFVSRAEFIKMLVAAQVPASELPDTEVPFADVRGHWVEPYIAWAMQEWDMEEWALEAAVGGMLSPDMMITRQEMALLAVIAAGETDSDADVTFDDSDEITPGFEGWVAAAVEKGLVQGHGDGTFGPRDYLTRAQAVVMVWRVLNAQE